MALEAEKASLLGEQQKLAGLQADLPSISDKLRDALQSRLEHPLMGQRAEAISQFFQAAPQARAEGQALLGAEGAPARPTAVEALAASRRGAALTPVMGLTGLIGAKLGGIEDVIQKGINAFQSLVAGQQGRVGLAQTSYDLALQQLVQQAQAEQQAWENQFAEQQLAQQWKIANLPPQRAPAAPKSEFELWWEEQMKKILEGEELNVTENKPTYTPGGGVGSFSQGGEWYFVGSEYYPDDWIPAVEW